MKRITRIAALLLVVAVAFAGWTASSGTANAKADVVGHVYVNNNSAVINTVSVFDRHADGSLTPNENSPVAIGGNGQGSNVPSQGALQLADNGHLLLAVDAFSNQISVVRVHEDGKLTPVKDSPFSSGGVTPVSIAVHDHLVYVANAGAGGSNYTGFTLRGDGKLDPIANSTFPLPDAAQPGDILFSPDGTRLAGMRVGATNGDSRIDSFSVGSNGLLTPAPGSPFTPQGGGPFGSEFRPTSSNQLFVTNAHNGGTNLGTVSAFSVAANGALSSIGSSPFADNQNAPCWLEISHDGNYAFVVNTASQSVSRFSVAGDGTLALLGSSPFSNAGPFDLRLDPTGKYLYVVGRTKVSAFSVNGGSVSFMANFDLPAQVTGPFGLVTD
jgi:6-phosphogluconolactonase